ncbi:hypothetical protein HMPREF0494_0265 [Limosilactobacillus antri DSM 16041]|uniref:Uncharacterized protein n=1 Tax=Limosilactobacillus antri DSM 16041 TaxID=525309 RepID=C8P4M1_9LACO|nr:hypothetical protein HMPREF0494_0265 [Limosilactobacillus antri DSM 16041]
MASNLKLLYSLRHANLKVIKQLTILRFAKLLIIIFIWSIM